MKKLMVAIAAAAISFAGFADDTNNWFTAGFGAEALSSGGAWSPDASSLTWGDENVLLLEDVEAAAPVVFAADEAKAGASTNDDTTVVFDTTVTFQGFDELPAIDANAKAGVCALTDGNYYVVAYDDVGSTNKWVDTGIDAAFDVAVNVKVTVANGKAVYTFTDQFGTNGTDPLDLVDAEFQEVCYSGNGSVSTLAADTILAGVAITLPVIDGLTVTCDKARAAVGEIVLLKFAADTKFPNRTEALYEVKANGELEFADDGDEPAGQDPGAMIEDAIYRDFEDAYTNAVVGNTIVLCSAQTFGGVSSVEKKVSVDINGFRFEIGNDLEVSSALTITDSKLEEAAGLLVLGAVVNLGEIGTLDISEVLWENVKDVGYVTGYGAELDIAVSPNMMFAKGALGAERPDMLIKCDDVEYYLDSDAEIETRYVNEFEVAYGTVVAGDLEYEETFDSVQAAIDATDEVYLSLYAGELPEDETELTFKPSTVVYAATGADDLDGVDLLPVGEVEFDESLGEFGGWKIPGEPPAPETITLSWTEDNDKMGTVVYIDENPVDNGAAVNTGDMAEFIVLPKTGYAYSTAPDGWELTPEGGITKTVEVEYASISVEIPEPTEIPVPTKQIQLPAGIQGVAGYIVSNVTDNIDIQADVLEEPVVIGKTYTLPLGKKVEIWVVPADGYRVTGNPYTIDEVTSETTVAVKDLPSVAAIVYVAQIDDVMYETLEEAIEAITVGQTVTLLADIELEAPIKITKQVELDIGEFNITPKAAFTRPAGSKETIDAMFVVRYGGDFTVVGTTGVINSSAFESIYSPIKLTEYGETYDGETRAKLTVDANLTGYYYAITGNGGRPGTDIVINGGTLTAVATDTSLAIYNPQADSTVIINDGTLIGLDSAVEMRGGELTVNGGTLTATATEYSVTPSGTASTTKGAAVAVAQHTTMGGIEVAISGGTLTGLNAVSVANPQENDSDNVEVELGAAIYNGALAFSADGNAIVSKTNDAVPPAPAGYKWNSDGILVQVIYVAKIGETKYETVAEAFASAESGDIVLLDNVTLTETLSVNKDFVLDLGDYTLTSTLASEGWAIRLGDSAAITAVIKNGKVVANQYGVRVNQTELELDGVDIDSTLRALQGTTASDIDLSDCSINAAPNAEDVVAVLMKGGALDLSGTKVYSGAKGLDLSGTVASIDVQSTVEVSGMDCAVFVGSLDGEKTELTVKGAVMATASHESENDSIYAISGNGTDEVGADVTICEDAIVSVTEKETAIYWPNAGTLTVDGGSITGGTAIWAKSGNVVINGGEISANGEKADYAEDNDGVTPTGDAIVFEKLSSDKTGYPNNLTASISGGTITSENGSAVVSVAREGEEALAGFVSGGTFSSAVPEAFCASGFIPMENGDGTFGVKEGAYVAQVADAKFETLAEAFAAVAEDGTVVILQNLTVESLDAITKDLTIDANGCVITLADAAMTLTNDITVVCSGETSEKGVKNEAQITIAAGKTLDLSALSWGAGVVGSDSGTASFTLEEGAVYKQGIGAVWDDAITNIFTAAGHCEIKLEKSDDVATITAEAIPPMFMIGEIGYADWASVYAAAGADDVIIVGANAVIPKPDAGGTFGRKVTIDLDGQALTFSGGWLVSNGSFTFIDSSEGDGQLSMPNGLNCSGTLDLSALNGDQVDMSKPQCKVGDATSLVKFPEDWDLDTCTGYLNSAVEGARIVVQGVTYTYNATKKLWVPEGCYFITITDPENGTLETSATNAVPAGTTVTVTAMPDDGYQLVSITTNGEAIVGTEFVMPEGDVTVAATFEAAQSSWDIPGGEGGINALVKDDGTKYVEFTEITLTATGATVGLHAKEIDANGQTFGLVCKTDLTKDETIVINATLSYEQGALGIPTQGTFTITAEALSGYDQLFVVGVGPAAK